LRTPTLFCSITVAHNSLDVDIDELARDSLLWLGASGRVAVNGTFMSYQDNLSNAAMPYHANRKTSKFALLNQKENFGY
jgi:hypothetical protein